MSNSPSPLEPSWFDRLMPIQVYVFISTVAALIVAFGVLCCLYKTHRDLQRKIQRQVHPLDNERARKTYAVDYPMSSHLTTCPISYNQTVQNDHIRIIV